MCYFQWFQMTALYTLFVNRGKKHFTLFDYVGLRIRLVFFIVQKCLFGTQLLVNDMEKIILIVFMSV